MGAALWANHMVLGKPRKFVLEHAYLGEEHSQGKDRNIPKGNNICHERIDDDESLISQVVEELRGWQGRGMVSGPF